MESSSVALFSRIEENINGIETCIQDIRKKHTRILSSPFQDEAEYIELDKLMAKVQSYSSQTWSLLKAAKQNKGQGAFSNRTSIRMETVQMNTLYQKFVDVLSDYSNAQTEFKERKKKLLKRQLEITGQQVDDNELEKMLDECKAVFTKDYIVEVEKTREDLTDVKKRCSQVLSIENSLRELDDMLLSLSILIHSQVKSFSSQINSFMNNNRGEILDSVEHHVKQASDDVKEGNKDIQKAVKKKKYIRKTKVAIAASLFVIGVLIVVILIIV